MLRSRLITAALGLPIFIVAILFLPALWFALLGIVLIAIAAWEWSQFLDLQRFSLRCIYTALVVASAGLTFVVPIIVWLLAALLVWIWALVALLFYNAKGNALGFSSPIVKGISGILLLIAFWLALNVLRDTLLGPKLLIIGFVLIWALDIAAYFVGRAFGKHYLIPMVSPNKTWEGLIAGLLAALLVVSIYALIQSMSRYDLFSFIGLGFLVALFAVVGDLFESLLKRQAGLKDSGNLFPGHGGVLDRFDSAIAALPIFALGLLFL